MTLGALYSELFAILMDKQIQVWLWAANTTFPLSIIIRFWVIFHLCP
jgi:hypothetical protein